VALDSNGYPKRPTQAVEQTLFAVSDGSLAIHAMMLTAWAEGIGSNWVGFAGRLGEVNGQLGIPDRLDVLAILPFGYPAAAVGRGKKNRKPLAEVACRERFGQPLA
jgi:nitroreductase